MKQQLMPLLLCLFVTLSVMSFGSITNNESQQNSSKNAVFQHFNKLNNDDASNLNEVLNSSFLLSNGLNKNGFYQYYSENSFGGGISLNKEFSYNIVDNSYISTAVIFSPVHFQGNFFNQGLFYGFAFTIILLNLVCYFIFDEKLFATFSASVAALTIVLFFSQGLFTFVGIDSIINNQLIQPSLLFISIGLSAYFASKFLNIKEFYKNTIHLTVPLFGISALLIIGAWIFNNSFIANISNTIMFGVLSLYFLIGVLLFSKKNYAKFYVIGTFIPLLFSIDFFVLKPFGIDFLFTEAVHLKVAVFFEILLLSYAIMYRMQAVKEEGELRQTEMRIFLKRQDVMSRNKVEELVEDVYLENLIMQYDLDGLEIKLLQYISEGKTNIKIARKLKLSEDEVVDYTKELYQKLEISEHVHEDYRMVNSQPDYIYN
ncbi:MAG: LuxR C-terminal-related transcriptional regulator [Flavobacteriaceae bacterium]|nr:LuxR C-terminal-related transcriptional regulator [Flavobacteriaceae bacterium]